MKGRSQKGTDLRGFCSGRRSVGLRQAGLADSAGQKAAAEQDQNGCADQFGGEFLVMDPSPRVGYPDPFTPAGRALVALTCQKAYLICTNRSGEKTMRDLKVPDQRHPEKAHRPDQEQPKKPAWIRVKAPTSQGYKETRDILRSNRLVTVCEEAGCPNVGECWSAGHATMMIMGDICTRGCSFCNIATGKPNALDQFEPGRVAHAVQTLGLKHVVVTSVDRDDLGDGGAEHFAQTIRAIRHRSPDTTIEILTPDFLKCGPEAVEKVVEARPDVFNHNLETVPGLYPSVRPGARYFHSLRLLQRVKELDPAMFTKSGIMVGLGEDAQSVRQVMDDMRAADVDFLTVGQYLQPTPKHHRVDRFVTPDEFKSYETAAYGKGFLMVSATPLTRSSYHAGDDFARLRAARLEKLGRA